jgi:hypothetical protein
MRGQGHRHRDVEYPISNIRLLVGFRSRHIVPVRHPECLLGWLLDRFVRIERLVRLVERFVRFVERHPCGDQRPRGSRQSVPGRRTRRHLGPGPQRGVACLR